MTKDTESRVETQVRLVLEKQCADLFKALMKPVPKDAKVLLFLLDYGGSGNVAFSTSFTKRGMLEALELLVIRWASDDKRQFAHDRALHGWVPNHSELLGLLSLLEKAVPAGVGAAVLFGKPPGCKYAATCGREGILKMLQDDVLPNLRREVEGETDDT